MGSTHYQSTGGSALARLISMRHAGECVHTPGGAHTCSERVDRTFPAWTTLAWASGEYQPYDLNQPLTIVQRRPKDYDGDPSITGV